MCIVLDERLCLAHFHSSRVKNVERLFFRDREPTPVSFTKLVDDQQRSVYIFSDTDRDFRTDVGNKLVVSVENPESVIECFVVSERLRLLFCQCTRFENFFQLCLSYKEPSCNSFVNYFDVEQRRVYIISDAVCNVSADVAIWLSISNKKSQSLCECVFFGERISLLNRQSP